MTWPGGGPGIPNYGGSSAYGTSYNAANRIPLNFLDATVCTSGTCGIITTVNGQSGPTVSITPESIGAEDVVNLVTGATADYNFQEQTGTTIFDHSGSANNATISSGTAWTGTGLAFDLTSGVSLPAALNPTKTFFFGFYINPFDSVTVDGNYSLILESSMAPDGTNFMFNTGKGIFQPVMFNGGGRTACNVALSGFHVLGLQLGTDPSTLDRYWIDGTECAAYTNQSGQFGHQTSGNMFLGYANLGILTGFNGTMYRFITYPTALTPNQMVQMSGIIANQAAQHGTPIVPTNVLLMTPQLHCIGDSITYGNGAAQWCSVFSLTRQPTYTVNNWGVPSALLQAEAGVEPNRVGTRCITGAGPSVAIVFSGTNDFLGSLTPAQVVSNYASEVQTLKHSGCQVFVATMLSRFYAGTNYDSVKDAFDELLISQAKAIGSDGVVDFAADPLMGANGAYANATYFWDQTHPTTAGQDLLAVAASNSLNYYFGYTLANPNVVTSTTYTLASADAAVTAAPTGNAAYTMPDCTGPSGALYTIMNPQAAHTLTITGGTSQPIDGLTSALTIANNSTVTLRDIANPKTVSGCHWIMQ